MPLLLAFDTSTETCSVALLQDERVLAAREVTRASGFGGHSEHVLQLVTEILHETGHNLSDCAAIAFGAGPGAFTGLRVACAVAQGLALGIECPLLAVDCLAAVAVSASRGAHAEASSGAAALRRRVLVLQDARMGEIYAEAVYIDGQSISVQHGPMLVTPQHDFAAYGRFDMVCGSAVGLYPELAALAPQSSNNNLPEASAVAAIGAWMLRHGQATDAALAAPIYVRDQVALTIAQRAAGQRMPA